MVDAYALGSWLADEVLNQSKPLLINDLMQRYCPYAVGSNVDDWIVPSPLILNSQAGKAYVKTLMMGPVKGLKYWLAIMNQLRDSGWGLDTFEGTHSFDLLKQQQGFQCVAHLLPIVRIRQGVSTRVDAEWVPYNEFMMQYNLQNISDLFGFIIQIILFGFPLFEDCARTLQIEHLGKYVASRLFQGEGDQWFGMLSGHLSLTSCFLEQGWDQGEDEGQTRKELERMMYMMLTGKRQKVAQSTRATTLRTLLMKGHRLGHNAEPVIAMMEADLFSFGDMEYERYLKHPNRTFDKVGFPIWKRMLYGEGITNPAQSGVEFWGDHSSESTDNYTGVEYNLVR